MEEGIWFGCITVERENDTLVGFDKTERHNYFWSGFGTREKLENDSEAAMYKEFPASDGWGEVNRAAYRVADETALRAVLAAYPSIRAFWEGDD
jgi:hypothetical protein